MKHSTLSSSPNSGNTIVSGIPQRSLKFRAWVRGYMTDIKSIDFYNQSILWDDGQYDRCDPPNKMYEIEPLENSVIMQFTGILDCNKKQIFEGDIVKWGHKKNSSECWHRYAIFQINPDLQLKIIYYKVAETQEQKPTDNHIFHWGRFAYGGSDLEIIGNIFENPELLG